MSRAEAAARAIWFGGPSTTQGWAWLDGRLTRAVLVHDAPRVSAETVSTLDEPERAWRDEGGEG